MKRNKEITVSKYEAFHYHIKPFQYGSIFLILPFLTRTMFITNSSLMHTDIAMWGQNHNYHKIQDSGNLDII